MGSASCRCNWAIGRHGVLAGDSALSLGLRALMNPINSDSLGEILRHYADADESSRLRSGWFQLEQARTRELILRHLPPAPATIIDAGGGAGVYACWLASLGYQVHLIDPASKHVAQAPAASAEQTPYPLASAEVGDARELRQAESSADAGLRLGPLYDLVERGERVCCVCAERRRVR